MKSIALIGMFILLGTFNVYSQIESAETDSKQNSQDKSNQHQTVKKSDYTALNLQQASTENLNLYLAKAKRLKTTGLVTTIGGPVMFVTGIVILGLSWGNYGAGLTLVGLTSTVVGIPVLIVGSKRVYKVKYTLQTHNSRASISVTPGFMRIYNDKNFIPGATLSISL